jgi:hypothetical protein
VLLDEKAHDEALKLLGAAHAAAFDAQYEGAARRCPGGESAAGGSTHGVSRGAREGRQGREHGAFRESLRMRLEALGDDLNRFLAWLLAALRRVAWRPFRSVAADTASRMRRG